MKGDLSVHYLPQLTAQALSGVAISTDGATLALAYSGSDKVIQLATEVVLAPQDAGKKISLQQALAHKPIEVQAPSRVAYAPAKVSVSEASSERVYLLGVGTEAGALLLFAGHRKTAVQNMPQPSLGVTCIDWCLNSHNNGLYCVVGSIDCHVCVMQVDLKGSYISMTCIESFEGPVKAVSFSPSISNMLQLAVFSDESYTLSSFDVEFAGLQPTLRKVSDAARRIWPLPIHQPHLGICWSPDGKRVLAPLACFEREGSESKIASVAVWNPVQPEEVTFLGEYANASSHCISWETASGLRFSAVVALDSSLSVFSHGLDGTYSRECTLERLQAVDASRLCVGAQFGGNRYCVLGFGGGQVVVVDFSAVEGFSSLGDKREDAAGEMDVEKEDEELVATERRQTKTRKRKAAEKPKVTAPTVAVKVKGPQKGIVAPPKVKVRPSGPQQTARAQVTPAAAVSTTSAPAQAPPLKVTPPPLVSWQNAIVLPDNQGAATLTYSSTSTGGGDLSFVPPDGTNLGPWRLPLSYPVTRIFCCSELVLVCTARFVVLFDCLTGIKRSNLLCMPILPNSSPTFSQNHSNLWVVWIDCDSFLRLLPFDTAVRAIAGPLKTVPVPSWLGGDMISRICATSVPDDNITFPKISIDMYNGQRLDYDAALDGFVLSGLEMFGSARVSGDVRLRRTLDGATPPRSVHDACKACFCLIMNGNNQSNINLFEIFLREFQKSTPQWTSLEFWTEFSRGIKQVPRSERNEKIYSLAEMWISQNSP